MKYHDKLINALFEHVEMVIITLLFSLVVASFLTILATYSKFLSMFFMYATSIIYSVPSLALFALLIPLTGLGQQTAIIVLVIYNQYLLLRNFITGLNEVNPAITEAATGIGMTTMQLLFKIKVPLAKKSIFTGIRISVVSTIGIATIAATINAGGLGSILFDGLRTLNVVKIVWGSLLAAGLAVGANSLLSLVEKRI